MRGAGFVVVALGGLLGCSGSDEGPVDVAGAAQKGPFVAGSRLDVSMIDSAANSTGTVYPTT